MLTTFVVRIGATTALLSFSTAVAAIAPALSSVGARRGRHLCGGLSGLLQQLGYRQLRFKTTVAY